MKFCKKCVQPDTRPDIYFNEVGICGACVYEEQKKNIDWPAREKELNEIVKWAKNKAKENNSAYDCVIGVSGGKDSTFQALYAKEKLGLHALLVNCEPEGVTEIGRKNLENLRQKGFDSVVIRPNPVIMRRLIKRDFFKYLNPVKVTEFTLWSSAYIIAHAFKIPLIIEGENGNITLGLRNNRGQSGDALLTKHQNTLASGWQDYLEEGITPRDLFLYNYDENELKKTEIKAIYLQYYTKEWTPINNANFSIKHGLNVRGPEFDANDYGTFITWAHLDGDLQQLNQLLKYIKFGFGQTTDDACYYIRQGLITREEAIELVRKYDGKCAYRFIRKFCDFIGITVEEFWHAANKFRGPMWVFEHGKWLLKETLW